MITAPILLSGAPCASDARSKVLYHPVLLQLRRVGVRRLVAVRTVRHLPLHGGEVALEVGFGDRRVGGYLAVGAGGVDGVMQEIDCGGFSGGIERRLAIGGLRLRPNLVLRDDGVVLGDRPARPALPLDARPDLRRVHGVVLVQLRHLPT